MKSLNTTDLARDNFDYPDDREATKLRIIGMFTCFALGAVFGAFLFMGIMNWQGINCIAGKSCSEHGLEIYIGKTK